VEFNNFDTESIYKYNATHHHIAFDKSLAVNWIENLFNWMFSPQQECKNYDCFKVKEIELYGQLQKLIFSESQDLKLTEDILDTYFKNISAIHADLVLDLKANLKFDPAAKSECEVILAYPGFFAITVYRVAHFISQFKLEILPRFFSEYAHSKTGIDIHPRAKIGKKFFIDHGTGIVIGETSIIGDNVKIYQGVTLGALSVKKELATEKRHPTIEDGVTIYANATILGGNTVIGREATIGGNVWITASIPPHSMVFHKSEIVVKKKHTFT